MIRINDILDKISTYIKEPDLALIQAAYVFSAKAHEGQVRLSGEPYLMHPLEVAYILAEMHLDEASVAAGLLHDTVEDTKATVEEIDDLFGENVADIVDGVTKISKMQVQFDSKEAAQAENIRKMLMAMAEDIRVLMVKLADRLHNMRTLQFQNSVKQKLIAQETLDIYAPLANRLGQHRIKVELEDLCLKYLKPDVYTQIDEGVEHHQHSGQEYIDRVQALMQAMFTENHIEARIRGRTKHIFSIYHKMLDQGLSLDQIFDLIAFRVIVPSVKDCYATLGLVHSIWKPIPGRFKDYISIPKANMYQSLHTTVVGPDGERIEIQIRTEEMHQIAEYGVAAHWQYKETSKREGSTRSEAGSSRDAERFTWLRQILDWQRELKDPKEFMASLRIDLFADEIFVFTPQGDVKELPEGATPVDFAYLIHTQVGDHCAGAKVNGRLVPLETKLKNSDSVEIITDKNRLPSRDWLKFVKTAKAKTRIKNFIRTEERARSITFAKELLEKEGRRMGLNVAKATKDGHMRTLAEEFSCGTVDDLLSNVGYSRFTPQKVLRRLWALMHPDEERPPTDKAPAEKAPAEKPKAEKSATAKEKPGERAADRAAAQAEQAAAKKSEVVQIKGVDDVLIRFAGCCNPLPGEPIVGYITRGRGVTIHAVDCPNISTFEPERRLEVSWGLEDSQPFPAKIKIRCKNIKGVLAKISNVLYEEDVNLDSGTFNSNVDGMSEIVFTVEVKDSNHLYRAIAKVKKLEPVVEVVRVT